MSLETESKSSVHSQDEQRTAVRRDIMRCLTERSSTQLAKYRADFSAKYLDPLLDTARFERQAGGTSKRIKMLQDEVLGNIKSTFPFEEKDTYLRNDTAFLVFAQKITALAARYCALEAKHIMSSQEHATDFIEHLVSHYQLVREAGVPPSIVKKTIHSFSVFEVGKTMNEAQEVFGSDPNTTSLVKTASSLVFLRIHPTITDAKIAYDKALQESKNTFGAEEHTYSLVKTAANLIFHRTYPSIKVAKERYDELLDQSQRTFGADPETTSLVKTAACLVLIKKYPSIECAKETYDRLLQEAYEDYGSDEKDTLPIKLAVCLAFNKTYPSVATALKARQR